MASGIEALRKSEQQHAEAAVTASVWTLRREGDETPALISEHSQ